MILLLKVVVAISLVFLTVVTSNADGFAQDNMDVEPCELKIGCPNDASVQGFASLEDLHCFMFEEASSTIFGLGFREPPYLYILCPNTVYTVTESNVITPILNDTWIACGNDGARGNNCTIVGGAVQVLLTDNPIELGHVMEYVSFFGLTFASGTMSSVLAMASSPYVVAEWFECMWIDNYQEMATILIANPTFGSNNDTNEMEVVEFLPAMSIHVFGSVFSGGDGLGFVVLDGGLILANVNIEGGAYLSMYQQSEVHIVESSMQYQYYGDVVVNPYADAIIDVAGNSSLFISESSFNSVAYTHPLINVGNSSMVRVEGCEFVDIQGNVIVSQHTGNVSVADICLINSPISSIPIYLYGESNLLQFHNVFTDGRRDCVVFQDCMMDQSCQSACIPADAASCSIGQPTAERTTPTPTPSPRMVTSSSSDKRSHVMNVILLAVVFTVSLLQCYACR